MHRRLLVLLAALGLAFASAQSLVVYSSVDEENANRILSAFTDATGIQVQMVFLSSGPALSRIEAEAARPQADVWFGAPSENHIDAKSRGLTQPYVSANADALIAEFKDAEGFWHAIYTNPLAFGVRADVLAERNLPVPTSWMDLLNPGYRGLIQMPSPQASGTARAVVFTLIELMGEDEAYAYMAELNANVQTYTQSGTAPSGALGLGETVIALQFSPGFLKLVDEGFPVQVVFPSEGVGYEVASMSILDRRAQPRRRQGARRLDDRCRGPDRPRGREDLLPAHPRRRQRRRGHPVALRDQPRELRPDVRLRAARAPRRPLGRRGPRAVGVRRG